MWFLLAVGAFLAVTIFATVLIFSGARPANSRDDLLILLFGVSALFALTGWWWDRSSAYAAVEEERARREELGSELQGQEAVLREVRERLDSAQEREDERRHAMERLESRLGEQERSLNRERYLRTRAEQARQSEQDWSRELHAEVMRLYRKRGALGTSDDVPSMVLRLALTLLEAGKGMLLWRRDSDGEIELARAEGFEHDPEESRIARRFAEEVMERDTVVRENEPDDLAGGTPADAEIENLVAIPIYVQDDFDGVVVCANRNDGFDDYDDEVLLSLGNHAGAVLENGRLRGELRNSYHATVGMLAKAIEVKDPFLRGHSEEVSSYVAAVADQLGLEERRREELIFASLLHDVGKLGISELILLKPGPLSTEEQSVIRLHPRIGSRLVEHVPLLRPMVQAILHHHEWFDGSGYPSGLRGEQIPLEARIICVADAFSAMTSERPYRERMSLEDACAELERGAGTQFDPEVVRLFVDEVRRYPPVVEPADALGETPSDPELETQRSGDEPILGHDAFAMTDSLTLLYSHRHFHELAAAEAQRAAVQNGTFAVVLIQLADIAEINRERGYAAGDRAIRTVAHAVQNAAAHHGGTACRPSGRSLGLIVPGADEASGERLAAEVSESLREGPDVVVGVAAWRPGEVGDDVIDRAHARLRSTADAG